MGRINASRLNRVFRWATASLRCRVAILMYHRVFESSSDPWELCVSPGHFGEHLEILSRDYQVLSLNELVGFLKSAQLPKRGVVLTFDDGYADNLWNAKPLLEKYEVPATVFVTSGSLDSPNEFWWDDLERVLLQPGKFPKHLHLNVQSSAYDWKTTNSDEREIAYMAIHPILQPLRASERDPIISELLAWADVDPMGRPDNRPLTTDELIQLAQSEWVDIGAHAVTHPFLSVMSQDDQSAEIAGSRQKLEEILGGRVSTFSYPFGNLTPETVDIVEAAGFEAALTITSKPVVAGDNLFQMGRFGVADWNGEKFQQQLDKFFRA
jgi:peptidoglycan/xylan/chitin deacetylase (PgdA/CDA1 family)